MYTLFRGTIRAASEAADRPAPRTKRRWVSPTVIYLGLTSLFTDISSEMVSSILPLYFIVALGFTPFQFGFLDGVYQGAAALVAVGSGFAADRWRRHKAVAASGYGLSAVAKLGLLAVGGAWAGVTGAIIADRTGKGIRTAPRDALIALHSPRESLGLAFGVHRALDTLGALIGPVLAFGLLTLAPGAYDSVFVVSFCAALIGLAVLVLFVRDRRGAAPAVPAPAVSLRAAAGLLTIPAFRTLTLVGTTLGLAMISDSFLYLVIQRQLHLRVGFFPLLFVATALVYFALAIPAGWLADRIGRAPVFVAGYALLLAVYALVLHGGLGFGSLALPMLLFGAYYAATDGVLMAQASAVLPAELGASGLAVLTTATNLSRLAGSIIFGAAWTWRGEDAAVTLFLVGLLAATVLAALALPRGERRVLNA